MVSPVFKGEFTRCSTIVPCFTATLRSDPDDDLSDNHRLSNLEHCPEIDGRWDIPPFLWMFDRYTRIVFQPPIAPTPTD